jgi:hypothetical protein
MQLLNYKLLSDTLSKNDKILKHFTQSTQKLDCKLYFISLY